MNLLEEFKVEKIRGTHFIHLPLYIEGKLQTQTLPFPRDLALDLLQLAYESIDSEQDIMIVFDGKEGSGKSFAIRQCAYVLNYFFRHIFKKESSFDSENIHYLTNDYIELSYKKQDQIGFINALDEGGDEIDKAGGRAKSGIRFNRYLRKCRKLQQVHLIAMPAAHDLTKYVALWRQKFIIKLEPERVDDEKSPTGRRLQVGKYRIIRNDQRWVYCYCDKVPYKYPIFLHKDKVSYIKDASSSGGQKARVHYRADQKGFFYGQDVFSAAELQRLKEKNLELAEMSDLGMDDKTKESKKDLIYNYLEKHPDARQKDIVSIFNISKAYASDMFKAYHGRD